MKTSKIGIIGCGNIGGTLAYGISKKGFISGEVLINDKIHDKMEFIAEGTGYVSAELDALVSACDIIIITVKPQDAEDLLKSISGEITQQTIVTVMAGIKIKDITRIIGKEVPVARVMPNMAAFVGESISCISFNNMVSETERIKTIFHSIGEVMEIDEELMDGVTALSGSGPAYLFYFAQAMIDAGVEMGFDRALSERLVMQTIYGSAVFMKDSSDSPSELINKVASKGGTTEAALDIFDKENLRSIIMNAVKRASERSRELSGE